MSVQDAGEELFDTQTGTESAQAEGITAGEENKHKGKVNEAMLSHVPLPN